MREIQSSHISDAVERLCLKAAFDLGDPVEERIRAFAKREESEFGKYIFGQILENIDYARNEQIAICQDTGSVILFVDVGQDLHISGGDLIGALNEGVRRGYMSGYLRKSICSDPVFDRKNTGDNTPAVIHTEIVAGDRLKIAILPKGGGSENMGTLKMLLPSQGLNGIKEFVLQSVIDAGGNPCPPIIVGVGIGGSMDKAAYLAKKALTREIGLPNPNPDYANLEDELLEAINATGIGPQGLGGRITALAVHIEYFPTHITQLPVAVNLNCHAARYAEILL
ncbi:MAG: fumarate hydratase [Clostridiales Family XIII bacterium]|nr:fumarate hydratase [Clostridiales Family XIII bacterium]